MLIKPTASHMPCICLTRAAHDNVLTVVGTVALFVWLQYLNYCKAVIMSVNDHEQSFCLTILEGTGAAVSSNL